MEDAFFTIQDLVSPDLVPGCHRADFVQSLRASPPLVRQEDVQHRADEWAKRMGRIRPGAPGAPLPSRVHPSKLLPVESGLHALDLCCGAGGLSSELEHAGCRIQSDWAVDVDKDALASLLLNCPDCVVSHTPLIAHRMRLRVRPHALCEHAELLLGNLGNPTGWCSEYCHCKMEFGRIAASGGCSE